MRDSRLMQDFTENDSVDLAEGKLTVQEKKSSTLIWARSYCLYSTDHAQIIAKQIVSHSCVIQLQGIWDNCGLSRHSPQDFH